MKDSEREERELERFSLFLLSFYFSLSLTCTRVQIFKGREPAEPNESNRTNRTKPNRKPNQQINPGSIDRQIINSPTLPPS